MAENRDIEVAKQTIDKEIDSLRILENSLDDALSKALEMPCLIAPACPVYPPPRTFTTMSYLSAVSVATRG